MTQTQLHLLYAHIVSMPILSYIGAFDCNNNIYNQIQYTHHDATQLTQWTTMLDNDVQKLHHLQCVLLPLFEHFTRYIPIQEFFGAHETTAPTATATTTATTTPLVIAVSSPSRTFLTAAPLAFLDALHECSPSLIELQTHVHQFITFLTGLKKLASTIFIQTQSSLYICGQLLARWPNHHIVMEIVHAIHTVKDKVWDLCNKQFFNFTSLLINGKMAQPIRCITQFLRFVLGKASLSNEKIAFFFRPTSNGKNKDGDNFDGNSIRSIMHELCPFETNHTQLSLFYNIHRQKNNSCLCINCFMIFYNVVIYHLLVVIMSHYRLHHHYQALHMILSVRQQQFLGHNSELLNFCSLTHDFASKYHAGRW